MVKSVSSHSCENELNALSEALVLMSYYAICF